MTDPAFFGYGSLVNLSTHDYAQPTPATLAGWRRVWRATRMRNTAFLSVERCNDTAIKGIIAHVPGGNWALLDKREAAYHRHDVSTDVAHNAPTAVYQVTPDNIIATKTDYPIMLSYLDVVVQGYLQVFGEDGVRHFFDTTSDWQPILNDRADPQYPRHQSLSRAEQDLVDHHLAAVMQ